MYSWNFLKNGTLSNVQRFEIIFKILTHRHGLQFSQDRMVMSDEPPRSKRIRKSVNKLDLQG
jgi:hypothetical protein